ncbi:hypothetical protein V6N12_054667 [Hibiscus sabdariffa]|uniref:Uncharacterized protein n=1 Tax=Hibiscus sabdariffa TaxID=183260 RepID=A0ABR2D144_9ROSI
MRSDSKGLHEIRRLSEAGKLNIPVEKTCPITQVREAHEARDKKVRIVSSRTACASVEDAKEAKNEEELPPKPHPDESLAITAIEACLEILLKVASQ